MFAKIFTKFNSFADHHQTFIALIIAFSILCISWGTEKLLEKYLVHYDVFGYMIAVFGGLLLLWATKHFVLHVM